MVFLVEPNARLILSYFIERMLFKFKLNKDSIA